MDGWLCVCVPYYDTNYTGKATPGPWSHTFGRFWFGKGFLVDGSGVRRVHALQRPGWADTCRCGIAFTAGALCVTQFLTPIFPRPSSNGDDISGRRPLQESDVVDPAFDFSLASRNWLDDIKKGLEWGGIKTSDTIAGLAKQLGLNPDKLTSAVEDWNAKCAAGQPDEWGRPPEFQAQVKKAPYYGVKTGVAAVGTFFGARVNENFQVLDLNQNPVPGLYAAGEPRVDRLENSGLNSEFSPLSVMGWLPASLLVKRPRRTVA